MGSSYSTVTEHTFEGQHIREHPEALVRSQEDALQAHVKEYVPTGAAPDSLGDVTTVGFHANGIHKETYQPFWEDLVQALRQTGVGVRSIWVADQASSGTSGVLNEQKLGNDAHWFDHSRDVLQMINVFRHRMMRPLVAVGHSAGGDQAIAVSHYHPRLFAAAVLVESSNTPSWAPHIGAMAKSIAYRPDTSDSMEAERAYMSKNPFFRGWDSRALHRYAETGFRSGPTVAHPHEKAVTNLTTKDVEMRGILRPNPYFIAISGKPTVEERKVVTDMNSDSELKTLAYQLSTGQAFRMLAELRPPVFFLLGKKS